jgi:hypothetical protein
MKKILLSLFLIIILALLIGLTVIFIHPNIVINPKNLSRVFNKTKIFQRWKWHDAKFIHEWHAWNHRRFAGVINGFCFHYKNETLDVDSCLEEISWDLNFDFNLNHGLKTNTLKPFKIRSSRFLAKISSKEAEEAGGPVPDIQKYWNIFWSDLVPDMDFEFKKIHYSKYKFDLKLLKQPKSLVVNSFGFKLLANPKDFEILAPQKYAIPKKLHLAKDPIYFLDIKLRGEMKKNGIPLTLTGQLESISIQVKSFLDLPLKGDFTSVPLRRAFLLNTSAVLELKNLKTNMLNYGPKPYNVLPAPFNVMNGDIKTVINTSETELRSTVMIKALTSVNLQSPKQALIFDVETNLPMDVKKFKPGLTSLGLDFHQVLIQLPRLSKKSPPPQFMPDARFKPSLAEEAHKKKQVSYELKMQATNEKAVHIRTDLLDEILRINFDLNIQNGKLQSGFLKILPLKTKIFKRPIRLEDFFLDFGHPESPVLKATLKFPLPEYKITLKLEGPLAKPRYVFQSEPPLPQNDIYAVLLFGRPLSDLDPDDKASARKTNQLLSQGILSLSVLYFLAGSPVEYVGYDPDSKNATAQFGLSKKSSLRVGGGREGVNSTAIRRTLGKGWYLDTSVQNSSTTTTNQSNYGVLLERIISY